MTHLRSLRDYITALEEIGEVRRIGAEADRNLEIGAVIRHSYDLRAPAPSGSLSAGIDAVLFSPTAGDLTASSTRGVGRTARRPSRIGCGN